MPLCEHVCGNMNTCYMHVRNRTLQEGAMDKQNTYM